MRWRHGWWHGRRHHRRHRRRGSHRRTAGRWRPGLAELAGPGAIARAALAHLIPLLEQVAKSGRPILFVAGATGFAPVKSLLEEAIKGDKRAPEACLLYAGLLREEGGDLERASWLLGQARKLTDRGHERLAAILPVLAAHGARAECAVARGHRGQAARGIGRDIAVVARQVEFGQQLGLAPSRLSFHLAALEQAGLIRSRRASRNVFYTVDLGGLGQTIGYLMRDCCMDHPQVRACCQTHAPGETAPIAPECGPER